MSIPLEQWQDIWQHEYLADYIPSGGSAVKILVADDQGLDQVVGTAAATARSAGFITVTVDSAITRCHLIQEIFFAVSRSIDWDTWTDKWLCRELEEAGHIVPDGTQLSDVDTITEASGVDPKTIKNTITIIVDRNLMNSKSLWYQFGIAMAAYCIGRIERSDEIDAIGDLTLSWLRGEKVSLSRLRPLRITERIGRHNARPILISLARWCHTLGIPGICIVMNLSAVYNPSDMSVHYTRAALLDLYELLRQFIDETEDMSYLSIIAVAGRQLTEDAKVGYDIYDAFKMRAVNDVRDRVKDNPLNTLVTIDTTDNIRIAE